MHKYGTDIHEFRGPQAAAFCALRPRRSTIRNGEVIRALRRCVLGQSQNHAWGQREKENGRNHENSKCLCRRVSIGHQKLIGEFRRYFDDFVSEVHIYYCLTVRSRRLGTNSKRRWEPDQSKLSKTKKHDRVKCNGPATRKIRSPDGRALVTIHALGAR